MSKHLTAACDLGQRVDHTAYSVIEKLQIQPGDLDGDLPPIYHYSVVELHRWPLRTLGGYRNIVQQLGKRIQQDEELFYSPLYYDCTGPGNQVIPIFRSAWREKEMGLWCPIPITITGAQTSTGGGHVAKLDLVTLAGTLFDEHRLQVDPNLPFADILLHEIEHYEMKVNPKGDAIYYAGRQGKHDDLVFSVLLGLLFSSRSNRECRMIPRTGGPPLPVEEDDPPQEHPSGALVFQG
jgi:hypothetical protein